MKLLLISTIFLLSFSTNRKEKMAIKIFSLPAYSTYLIRIDSEKIKTINGVAVKTITNQKKVNSLLNLVNNQCHFLHVEDSAKIELDLRILIEVIQSDRVIKTICCSSTGRINIDNKQYISDKALEMYLSKEGLII